MVTLEDFESNRVCVGKWRVGETVKLGGVRFDERESDRF